MREKCERNACKIVRNNVKVRVEVACTVAAKRGNVAFDPLQRQPGVLEPERAGTVTAHSRGTQSQHTVTALHHVKVVSGSQKLPAAAVCHSTPSQHTATVAAHTHARATNVAARTRTHAHARTHARTHAHTHTWSPKLPALPS